MADNPYVGVVPDTTTGADAATILNAAGEDAQICIHVVSAIAEVTNEITYFKEAATIVYAQSEQKYYYYDSIEDDWLEVKLVDSTQMEVPHSGTMSHEPTVDHTITHIWSAGRIDGFDITDNGDGTIDVAAGDVFLRDADTQDDPLGNLIEYHLEAYTGLELTDNSTNYVYADYTDGSTSVMVTTDITNVNSRSKTLLHIITRVGTDLHRMAVGSYSSDFMAKMARKWMVQYGIEYGSGAITSEVDTRKLSVTAGAFYFIGERKTTDAIDTSADGVFELAYRSAVPGVWTRVADQVTVPNDKYDDGTGTLHDVSNNKFGVMWVYMCLCDVSPHLVVVYGQGDYSTLADAEAAQIPSSLPQDVQAYSTGKLIAKIVFQQGGTNFTQIDIPMRETIVATSPTIHNGLAGLQGGQLNEYYHLTSAEQGVLSSVATGVFGDETNNTTIDTSTGRMTMAGTGKVWDDLRVEPVARTTGTYAPTFEKWYDDVGGTSRGIYLYSFDDAAVNAEKEVFFTMQMPHSWDGGDIHLHCHWVGNISDTTAAPYWGFEYQWVGIGQVFSDTTIVYTDGKNYTLSGDDANITANKHYISEAAAITPPTGADSGSSILVGRLFRHSSNVLDTYNVADNKCGLLYIDAHFQINSLGSADELPPAPA